MKDYYDTIHCCLTCIKIERRYGCLCYDCRCRQCLFYIKDTNNGFCGYGTAKYISWSKYKNKLINIARIMKHIKNKRKESLEFKELWQWM